MPIESMAEVLLEPVAKADRGVLVRLFQLYRHDSSEYDGEMPDERGAFSLGAYFDRYWVEPTRHPYFIQHAQRRVGFVLVRQVEPNVHSIAEFFVSRGVRRLGIGRAAAVAAFTTHPGQWRVAQDERNEPAQRFWLRVIDEFTDGDFVQTISPAQPRGPEQRFDSAPDSAADRS